MSRGAFRNVSNDENGTGPDEMDVTENEKKNENEKHNDCNEQQSIPQVGRGPKMLNKTLLMGTTIGRIDLSCTGTLGGFLKLPYGRTGCLTCAHVVGSLTCNDVEGKSICQPSYGEAKESQVFGQVEKAVFKSGNFIDAGVDAALVVITARHPKDAEFIELEPSRLLRAGLSPDNNPKFSRGRIMKHAHIDRQRSVIKVGAETGLTRGAFYLAGTFVRPTNKKDEERNIPFYNQYEIRALQGCPEFFDLGDSGSLVFMPYKDDDELHCVGLAIGKTNYSCLVTPIETVLKELGLNENSFLRFPDNSQNITRGCQVTKTKSHRFLGKSRKSPYTVTATA